MGPPKRNRSNPKPGIEWPKMTIRGTNTHVFAVGDWGGLAGTLPHNSQIIQYKGATALPGECWLGGVGVLGCPGGKCWMCWILHLAFEVWTFAAIGFLVVWNIFSHMECHHPKWRTPSFFRGVGLNHQPDSFEFPHSSASRNHGGYVILCRWTDHGPSHHGKISHQRQDARFVVYHSCCSDESEPVMW